MDRTLSMVLAILAVAVVIFLVIFSLTIYMGIEYRATLASTYDYQVSIASTANIGNVTLYLPIPGRLSGNSAVLEGIGRGGLTGLRPGWRTSFIGTEKITLLEVTAPEIPATLPGKPYLLSITARVKGPVGTESEGFNNLVLAPISERDAVTCPSLPGVEAGGEARCEVYQGSAYADFTGPRNADLRVYLSLTGRNTWDIFGPSGNEYRDGLDLSFSGDQQGWRVGEGLLVTGIGDYGIGLWAGWAEQRASPRGSTDRQVLVTPAAGGHTT